ncbi:MAG: phospholipase A [Gammaproteobacteria bacterium]|nr:phospholipase A [Gammaproteobacteria bacterium]NVK88426.1 phospholipase A [Gammaproteobacteria bacterium]
MRSSTLWLLCCFLSTNLSAAEPTEKTTEEPELSVKEQVAQTKKKLHESTKDTTLLNQRLMEELDAYENSFALIPHKVNYILPFTYQDSPNNAPYSDNRSVMHSEVKFQVSFKVPVIPKTVFAENGYLFFGYTSRSVWQAYNTDESSPFRDTNHEPEIMLMFTSDAEWLGARIPAYTFGFSHQSNGQPGELSRSWNRIYLDVMMEYEDFYLSFKPWWRLPERSKRDINDVKGDDNPDIDDFYGYFELRGFRRIHDNELSLMIRNNLRSDNKGAIELNYSYPFSPKVRGYVQIFHGYGETLLDYNHKNTRIGIGFMLNNWL